MAKNNPSLRGLKSRGNLLAQLESGRLPRSLHSLVMTMCIKKQQRCGASLLPLIINCQLSIVNFLVDQLILLRAEAWEGSSCADAVATLGYNLENINLWSRIAQNISFHNAFEFNLVPSLSFYPSFRRSEATVGIFFIVLNLRAGDCHGLCQASQ